MSTFGRSVQAGTSLALGLTTGTVAAGITITNTDTTVSYPIYAEWTAVHRKKTGIKQIYTKTIDFGASGKSRKANVLRKYGLLQRPAVMGNESTGYVENPYVLQNQIAYVLLKNHDSRHVKLQQKTFHAAAADANWENSPAMCRILTNEQGQYSWPTTSAIFVLMHNPVKKKRALELFSGAYAHGNSMVTEMDYITRLNNVVKRIETWQEKI